MTKASSRIEMKKHLSMLTENDLLVRSRSLSGNLVEFIPQIVSEHTGSLPLNIGVFSPIQQEPKWYVEMSFDSSLSFSVVHIQDDENLSFYATDLETVSSGVGLRLEEDLRKSKQVPDVVIVPGLCFGPNMERLGRGGGYYDRFLADFSGFIIGVCFDFQMIDEVETNKFDKKMDIIVTDKNIYNKRT